MLETSKRELTSELTNAGKWEVMSIVLRNIKEPAKDYARSTDKWEASCGSHLSVLVSSSARETQDGMGGAFY